jgi:hypothetical protein
MILFPLILVVGVLFALVYWAMNTISKSSKNQRRKEQRKKKQRRRR